jgi:hypothetical protein
MAYVIEGEACFETPTLGFTLHKGETLAIRHPDAGRGHRIDASPGSGRHRPRRGTTCDNAMDERTRLRRVACK